MAIDARRLPVGRQTLDEAGWRFGGAPFTMVAPDTAESRWRLLRLDTESLMRMDPWALMDLIADTQPPYARALYDVLRLGNPGWELVAKSFDSDEPDKRAQAFLDDFMDELTVLYGTVDVVWNRLIFGAYHRGAVACELVLDEAGRAPVDFATPDPRTIRFRRGLDPDRPARGQIWRAGQWQGSEFVIFDRPTIAYVPVDPFPGSPYGRPLGAPALFTSLFLLGLLHDLRRVIAQQGWPRQEIVIVTEKLAALADEQAPADPAGREAWMGARIAAVQSAFSGLEPDDAFFHPDWIEMGKPQGAVDSSSLGAIEPVVNMLERNLVQALKTMPLLMALTEGTSEANANRQWEVHAAGVKSLQHLVETPVGRLLSLALQAGGIPARAELRFAELRAAEQMRDEQTRALRGANAVFERDQGFIDQDEAAQNAVGHAAIAPPSPFAPTKPGGTASGGGGVDTQTNPEPGSNRQAVSSPEGRFEPRRGVRLTPISPAGAANALPSLHDEPPISPEAERDALALWRDLVDAPYQDLIDAAQEDDDDATTRTRANGHSRSSVPGVA